jgi:circadian clock protein KaiC
MVVDPIDSLLSVSTAADVRALMVRLIDGLKERQVTGLFTSLTTSEGSLERTDAGISSLIDTWVLLRDVESGGERHRGLLVLKARGMSHSRQVRELLLTGHGIELLDGTPGQRREPSP